MEQVDVEGVTRRNATRGMKHVTDRLTGWRAETFISDEVEAEGCIEQSHVNTTFVGTVGHDVLVAQLPQGCSLGETGQYAVVLHFTQPNDFHGFYAIDRHDGFADFLQLLEETIT